MNRFEIAFSSVAVATGLNACTKPNQVRDDVPQSEAAALAPQIPAPESLAIKHEALVQTALETPVAPAPQSQNPLLSEYTRVFEDTLREQSALIDRSNHIHAFTDQRRSRETGSAIDFVAEDTVSLCFDRRRTGTVSACDPTTCITTFDVAFSSPIANINIPQIAQCIDAGLAQDAEKIPDADSCKLLAIGVKQNDLGAATLANILIRCEDNGSTLPKAATPTDQKESGRRKVEIK